MTASPRRPAVAGTFYPGQPAQLDHLVSELLDAAAHVARPAGIGAADILGLLVPHAGLVYSGAIAALSWRLAGELAPTTIVLAGTDHEAWADGVGVWTDGPWQTPNGETAVDPALTTAVVALGTPFAPDNGAHLDEHSLEVQLPLLLRVLPRARIVALAVSPRLRAHEEAGRRLGRLLSERRAAGERILLVASSDLAHYPPARVCEQTDTELLEPLLRLDADALYALDGRVVSEGRPGVVCGLCGIDPVRFTLAALKEMGATHGFLLGKGTSADAGGDPKRTVGYASAAFT